MIFVKSQIDRRLLSGLVPASESQAQPLPEVLEQAKITPFDMWRSSTEVFTRSLGNLSTAPQKAAARLDFRPKRA
ncbi:MAG: hypothetical protein IID41_01400 [Planctomycetes bacterium]|nr:hypothetical protein [Planctomycetota bacterium]